MSRIAIDFDGVIFDKARGTLVKGAKEGLYALYKPGNELTIFTNRPDYDYSTVKCILDSNDLPYHRIVCGKPSYDLFIDDRAATFTGWDKEYR